MIILTYYGFIISLNKTDILPLQRIHPSYRGIHIDSLEHRTVCIGTSGNVDYVLRNKAVWEKTHPSEADWQT
jgi:hypothetical protein